MLDRWLRRSPGPPSSEPSRLDLLDDLERRARALEPGYRVWGYKNVFAKGFLLTAAPATPPRDTWQRIAFGGRQLHHDPELDVEVVGPQGGAQLAVLGQAFAEGGPATRAQVAGRLLRALERDGVEALDEEVAWLSGRFVVLASRAGGGELLVYNDPLASRACYWHRTDGGEVVLGSHTGLIAEHAGGLDSTRMRWALHHPDYRSPFGRWLPGTITAHDGVGQVYANNRLSVRGGEVRAQRFFPREDRVERRPEDAAEEFREALREQVRNWASVAPTTVLALTAGADSRAVLDAGLDLLREADALALTYHPFHVPKKSTYDDFATANRLAAAARLPHLVLDVAQMSPRSPMAGLYHRTFPSYRRYANLANALYLGAPARATLLFAVGGGVVTGMFGDVSDPVLTPQLLARKYAYSKFADDPELHAEMAAWMDRTDFSIESLRGHSFYDFFHWEHRMSKWAAEGYSEYDLATIPAPVLSSRRLLLASLELPHEARTERALYASLRRPEPGPGLDSRA